MEEGVCHSVPNNPATALPSAPWCGKGDRRPGRSLANGMFTDDNWKIIVLLLNKLGPGGPIQPPFSAVRIS